jgi:hypothetical protein
MPVVEGAGEILSCFDANLTQTFYGMDIMEDANGTMLYCMTADSSVYRYRIDTASAVKDGSESQYDSRIETTDPNVSSTFVGFCISKTNEGDGYEYLGIRSNREVYRSRWGLEGSPTSGNSTWARISNAYAMCGNGDITPVDRGSNKSGIWVPSTITGYSNSIHKFPYPYYTDNDDILTSYNLGKELRSVSLGDDNDLWVLAADREILHVKDDPNNMEILDRFYLDSSLTTAARCVVYDPCEKSLWVNCNGNYKVYQININD